MRQTYRISMQVAAIGSRLNLRKTDFTHSVCLFPFHARAIFSGTSIWKSSSYGSFPETILLSLIISSYPFKCISSKVPATAAQAVLPASRVCCKSSGISEERWPAWKKKSQHPAALNPKLPEILPRKSEAFKNANKNAEIIPVYSITNLMPEIMEIWFVI